MEAVVIVAIAVILLAMMEAGERSGGGGGTIRKTTPVSPRPGKPQGMEPGEGPPESRMPRTVPVVVKISTAKEHYGVRFLEKATEKGIKKG